MIKVFYRLCFPVICLLVISCTEEKRSSSPRLNPPEKNEFASYFKIYKQEGYSILVTYQTTNKKDSAIYILYAGKKPELNIPANYVKVPVEKVACLSSVFVGFLEKLNVLNTVIAVDNGDFISNSFITNGVENDHVKQLSRNGQLNLEETLMSEVQILFTNPSGDHKKDFDKRLIDIGIIPIVLADYYENHPLGRAEWIKVFALFFHQERMADSLFNLTKQNYFALKEMADTCKLKPSVFTEVRVNDAWFVAGGKSSLAQLLNDAGANYLWKDDNKTEATALNMEQVFQKALNADYWLNLHFANSVQDVLKLDKRYSEFNAYKKGNLYNNNALLNKAGGNAYWEYGLCNPDEILRDLVKIFHPHLLPDHTLKYYKQLK